MKSFNVDLCEVLTSLQSDLANNYQEIRRIHKEFSLLDSRLGELNKELGIVMLQISKSDYVAQKALKALMKEYKVVHPFIEKLTHPIST